MPNVWVDVDQVSEDRAGKPQSLGCTVRYGGKTTALVFLDVSDTYPPLRVDAFRAELLQLADALKEAATSDQAISVHLPVVS